MFFQRRSGLKAGSLLAFQIVAIFLITESFQNHSSKPTIPITTAEISIADKEDVPSVFPKQSNVIQFQGPPILEMKNFEKNITFKDVINIINLISNARRQGSILADQTTHLDSASKRTETPSIRFIQNIIIYQNPTENTKWYLLTMTVILLGVLLAFSLRRCLLDFRNQYPGRERLITCDEFKESINVIDRK